MEGKAKNMLKKPANIQCEYCVWLFHCSLRNEKEFEDALNKKKSIYAVQKNFCW